MLMAVDRKLTVRLNGDTGDGVIVDPPEDGDIVETPGLFLKRGKVFSVTIENKGIELATGVLALAE